MAQTERTMVVLIDAEDVKYAFAGWPDDICLAACLDRDGDCSMVVFRRDERAQIPQRLMRMLQLESDEVCFVPKVAGFPTKHFLYSDERRLMALVGSDSAVLDEAIDYAVNYTYALEEGLDPAVVLGLAPEAPVVEPKPRVQREAVAVTEPAAPAPRRVGELSPLLPDFLRKAAEQSKRPRFASVRKARARSLEPQV